MWMPSLNWQLQLHLHHIVRHIPVEYLQLWRGFFAGITLLDREALLLCVKVEAKEQSLEYGAMHYRAKVPPQPNPHLD